MSSSSITLDLCLLSLTGLELNIFICSYIIYLLYITMIYQWCISWFKILFPVIIFPFQAMIRARAHRSEEEVPAASSDEDSMDIEKTGPSNPSDGLSSTLSRGRGRARGRARGARGQNSTARGSSRRGRGKKNFAVFVLQFLTFFLKKVTLFWCFHQVEICCLRTPTGKKNLLSNCLGVSCYIQLTALQGFSLGLFRWD